VHTDNAGALYTPVRAAATVTRRLTLRPPDIRDNVWRMALVLAAAESGVATIAFVDLQVARIRFYPGWDEAVERFAELTRGAASIDPADKNAVTIQIQTPGIALGVAAMVVVAMLAVTIVRPGSGARVAAVVGSLLVLVAASGAAGTTPAGAATSTATAIGCPTWHSSPL
jgi:hypothetical protein